MSGCRPTMHSSGDPSRALTASRLPPQQTFTFNVQNASSSIATAVQDAQMKQCDCTKARTMAAAVHDGPSGSVSGQVYNGQGSLPPNTYIVSTAGPQIKVAMGGCPDNLQAMDSRAQKHAGSFASRGGSYGVYGAFGGGGQDGIGGSGLYLSTREAFNRYQC